MGTTKREVSRLIDRNRAGYIVVVVVLLALAFFIHRPDRKSAATAKTVGVESATAEIVESDATVSESDSLMQPPQKKKRSRKSSGSTRKSRNTAPNALKSSRQTPLSPLDSPL